MKRLIDATSFTAHLAVLRGGDAVYIEKSEPRGFFRLNTWIGQRIHIHTSAVGKALVCELAKTNVQDIWRRGAPRRTSSTITSFRRFWSELRNTTQRAYALDDEEDQIGGRCVAVPIRSGSGKVIAALGISAMTEHLSMVEAHRMGRD